MDNDPDQWGQALEAGGTEKEAGPLGRGPGPGQKLDAGSRGSGPASARSNGPYETWSHKDSKKEVDFSVPSGCHQPWTTLTFCSSSSSSSSSSSEKSRAFLERSGCHCRHLRLGRLPVTSPATGGSLPLPPPFMVLPHLRQIGHTIRTCLYKTCRVKTSILTGIIIYLFSQ